MGITSNKIIPAKKLTKMIIHERELLPSKSCPYDYKKKHCWAAIGMVCITSRTYRIWHCSQCDKIIHQEMRGLIE